MKPTAFITGASRGIGKATAEVFASHGYNLYLTCRNSYTDLMKYKAYLEQTYAVKCCVFAGDVGNFCDVQTWFQEVERIDVLINNAGISYMGLLSDMSCEDWQKVIQTNLSSCFHTCKLAIPYMIKEKRGKILNVSSIWGNIGASTEVAYSASKGGVNAFTMALAKELAPSNIQVNAAAFGVIDTDMNRLHLTEEELCELASLIPADRLGTPMEAAQLLYQLAVSPSYLTGQIVTMDGGFC